MKFSEPDAAALAAAKEIKIETRATGGAVHKTIIWVVEHEGTVYIRSVNGPTARWYREAVASSEVAIHVSGRRIPARVEAAADADAVEACSEGLRTKYRRSYSLKTMLADDVLSTTLRLVPA